MSAEQNKALIRRLTEEVNRGNLAVVDEVFADDFKNTPLWPDPRIPVAVRAVGGAQGLKEGMAMVRAAFPDYTSTIEELTAEGDIVVLCTTWRGTHTGGDYLGHAPTGKRVQSTGFYIHRFAGGKVVEVRGLWDRLGTLQQLGIVPSQEELFPDSRPVPSTP
jgi:predicted ester cyclase